MNARPLLIDLCRDLKALEADESKPGKRAFIAARRMRIEAILGAAE